MAFKKPTHVVRNTTAMLEKMADDNGKGKQLAIPANVHRPGTSEGLRGYQLEVNLLTHVLCQAKERQLCFHLGTNVNGFAAFDDLVFISSTNPKLNFVLQAKQGKAVISDDTLLKRNGDFSLLKYVNSYRTIKEAKDYEGLEFTPILYTTSRSTLTENRRKMMSSNLAEHESLEELYNLICVDIDDEKKKPMKFQLNKTHYLNNIIEFAAEHRIKNLAIKLIEHVKGSAKDEELTTYEFILAEYVVDIKTKKIKTQFIENNQNGLWSIFRESMITTLKPKASREEKIEKQNEEQNVVEKQDEKREEKEKEAKEKEAKRIELIQALIKNVSPETISEVILTDVKYHSDQERMELIGKFSKDYKNKVKAIKDKFKQVPKKTVDRAFELVDKKRLESVDFTKLFDNFAKGDHTTRENIAQTLELAPKFIEAIKQAKSNKISIDQLLKCFGGLDSVTNLIGSLLVLDTDDETFKFNLNSIAWKELFNTLKQNPVVQLDKIRFVNNVPGFPLVNDRDRLFAEEFLDKLWFYVDQADGDAIESYLNTNLPQKYSICTKSRFCFQYEAKAIVLQVNKKILSWWTNPPNDEKFKSGWLTEECNYFEEAKNKLMKAPTLNSLDALFHNRHRNLDLFKFTDDALEVFEQDNLFEGTLNIKTNSSALTSLKLRQYFTRMQNNCFFISWDDVISFRLKKDIENDLKNLTAYLVIIVDDPQKFKWPCLSYKKCILVSDEKIEKVEFICDKCRGLIDLTADYQARLLESQTIWFQDEEVSLSRLIHTQELKEAVDSKTLEMLLAGEEIQIGNSLREDVDTYTHRTFQRQTMFERYTLETDSELLIVESGNIDETQLGKEPDLVTISDNDEVFHILRRKFAKRNIHWFKEQDENLLWQKSNGKLSKLRKNALKFALDIDVENNDLGPVVMLAAEPGMGKSTTFSNLAKTMKHKRPTSWVANVCLREQSGLFLEWKSNPVTPIEATQSLLLRNDSEEKLFGLALLEKEIFNCLWQDKKIIILLDGYDEISPTYEEEVLMVLSTLKEHKIESLWIATRSNLQLKLEEKFNLFALSLKQFEKVDQIQFLKALCEKKNQTEDRLTNFCREVLSRFTATIKDDKAEFVGIPLQLRMIASVFAQLCKDYCNSASKMTDEVLKSKLKENYNLIDLYKEFFRIKFVVVLNEEKEGVKATSVAMKQQLDTLLEHAMYDHRILATVALLDKRFCNLFLSTKELSKAENLLTNISQEKTGIVYRVQYGQPVFVHQTFAEYFIVDYFWEKLNAKGQRKSELFMLTVILGEFVKLNRSQILRFIQQQAIKELSEVKSPEGISVGTTRMCEAILNLRFWNIEIPSVLLDIVDSYLSLMNKISTDPIPFLPWLQLQVDPWDSLFLTCVRKGFISLTKCLEKTFDSWNVDATYHIFQTSMYNLDKMYDGKHSVLHVAADAGYMELVEHFTAARANINVLSTHGMTPLMYASRRGHFEIVKFLLNKCADVGACDSENRTALFYAAKQGHTEIVRELVNPANLYRGTTARESTTSIQTQNCLSIQVRIIDAVDCSGYTALHIAAENGHIEAMKVLLAACVQIDADTRFGKTALMLALQSGHLKAAECLLENGADVDALDSNRRVALHYAAEQGHSEIMDRLITTATSVDAFSRHRETALILSSKAGHVQTVDFLLGKNAKVNRMNSNRKTALHYAAKKGHLKIVEKLLTKEVVDKTSLVLLSRYFDVANLLREHQVDVNVRTSGNQTALHCAARRGHVNSIRNLVAAEANINATDEDGQTALMILLDKSFLDAANYLMMGNVDVKVADSHGQTPLHFAAKKGLFEIFETLVDKGAEIDAADENGQTALMLSLDRGFFDAADVLLENGASVSAVDSGKCTALHIAARNGYVNSIEKLLKKEAPIDAATDYGKTALMLSIERGIRMAAHVLLDANADVNIEDSSKRTALHYAAEQGFHDRIVRMVEAGALVDAATTNGETALLLSLLNDHFNIAEYLLEKNAGVDAKNSDGRTALHYAAENGCVTIIEKLLKAEAQINATTTKNETALMLALASNHLEVADILLKHDARLDFVASNGMTMLHYAAKSGHMSTIKKLVDAGADVNATTSEGYTPLKLSLDANHLDVAHCLLMHDVRLDFVSSDKMTMLHYAAKSGHMPTIKKLVDAGADVNATAGTGDTPLMLSLQSKQLEAANYFVDKTTNIQAVNLRGLNALHFAAEQGYLPIVKKLVNRGMKVNNISKVCGAPFHLALKRNFFDVAEYLLMQTENADYLNSVVGCFEVTEKCPPKILQQVVEKGLIIDVIYKKCTDYLVQLLRNGQHEDVDSILYAAA